MILGTISCWAELGTVVELPAETVIRHHLAGDLLRGDYLLVSTETALALYEAGQLSVLTFAMLSDDVQVDIRVHMRAQVEARRRESGEGSGAAK